ncbi:unnamed protein product, partial [Meganyctiphanes norvegica]
ALFCMATSILATAAIDVGQTSLLKFFAKANFETGLRKLAFALRAFPHKNRKTGTTEQNFEKGSVSKQAMDQAKQTAIRIMQADMFGDVLHQLKRGNPIKKGPYRKLNLFIDKQGIIRCMGRLNNLLEPKIKNDPIFVHGKHPFIESFIRYKHHHSNCASKQYTLHKVRQEVHGPSLTVTVNKIVRECNACRVLRARPYTYPPPLLPKARLAAERPFAVCGVDYSGPHQVKHGRGTRKVWIALFTCMVSRAVHLEIAPDSSGEAFLRVLQSLSWKMGTPKVLLSDNATNFAWTNRVLKEFQGEKQVQDELAIKGIEWKFTPPYAPWFGAVFERMVGILKKELVKLIGHSVISHFELTAYLAEIQGVINNRPLVKIGTEEVLTPNNILTGRNYNNNDVLNVIDPSQILEEALTVRKELPRLFTETAKRCTIFWQKFQQQYLEHIKFSNIPAAVGDSALKPKTGDLVIIHSHDPRLQWRK